LKLAKALNLSAQKIYEKIKDRDKRFVWIERRLDEHVRNEISSWKIPGLNFVEESKRIFPNEQMLSPVLGFIGSEGRGLEG